MRSARRKVYASKTAAEASPVSPWLRAAVRNIFQSPDTTSRMYQLQLSARRNVSTFRLDDETVARLDFLVIRDIVPEHDVAVIHTVFLGYHIQ